MPELLPVEAAQKIVLEHTNLLTCEDTSVLEALGRPLAQSAISDIDVNHFDDAAMDGFAVRSVDVAAASPSNPISLAIVAHIGAGAVFDGELAAGQAVRIMTGAAMAAGADAVLMIEKVSFTGAGLPGDELIVTTPIDAGKNVRPAGEEAHVGQVVMEAGDIVTPAAAGLLASTGNLTVQVHARPRVGIISIGTELVDPENTPGAGMKRNSNRDMLSAMVISAGGIPHPYPTAPDDPKTLQALIAQAAGECDFVVSSGGACGGDFDYISQSIAALGTVLFDYINMRPGKAQTFGIIGETLAFGLSGNPAAAATGFEILVRPALRKAQGYRNIKRPITRARLACDLKSKERRRFLLRGRVEALEDGSYLATPEKNQSSALVGTTHRSNCFIVIPENGVVPVAGMEVDCIRIDIEEGTVV